MSVDRRTFLKVLGSTGAMAASATARAREPVAPDPESYGMLYDSTQCIGCKACVVACADANDLQRESTTGLYQDPVDLSASTKTVIKLHRAGDRTAFLKKQCMHCVDPACVSACMLGALHKAEHGVVAYDPDLCVGCRYCQVACPFDIPRFQWNDPTPLIVKCELCRHRFAGGNGPACCETCPTGAVVFGKRAELLREAKQRLERQPHRYNPKVYGETDGGGTQVLVLAGRGVEFFDLGLPRLGDEPVPHLSETVQHGIYQGFIAPIVLYGALGVVIFRNRRRGGSAAVGEEEKK